MHLGVVFAEIEGFGSSVSKWRRTTSALAQSLLFVVVTACAGLPESNLLTKDSPTKVKAGAVMNRAESRWRALIDGDLVAAYAYLSPSSRSAMTVDQYKAKHRVGFYRAASVDDVMCEAEVCTVKLRLTYDAKAINGIVTPISEKWVIDQGQAWIVEVP